jgi:hypothetical protein
VGAREERVAENEVRFRALNERLRQTGAAWEGLDGLMSLVCECGDEGCTTAIRLAPDEYEAVRAGSAQFALVSGHVRPEVEDVVTRSERWVVVRKRGEAGEIAAASDPRAVPRE